MSAAPLDRRTVLRSGGLAVGSLALGGAWRLPAATAGPVPAPEFVSEPIGSMLAWITLDFDQGGTVRLVRLEHGRPAGELATDALPLLSPPAALLRAHELAVRTIADHWNIPPAECATEQGRIAHPATGRSVGYATWVDFA